MSPGAEVTRLGATDLGSEMPDCAQQGILDGVDVAGTSALEYMAPSSVPQILTPSSTPCILTLSIHSKRAPVPSLTGCLHPLLLCATTSLLLYSYH